MESALRSMLIREERGQARADRARDDARALRLRRWPLSRAVLDRCWELRANLTPYDGAYVAVAELVDATLVSTDARLLRAVRSHTDVAVLDDA